jgi:UDP-N-acetylmuramoyl-L-alanyl-D-glutamate--2,6-diaminopimelate ligase
MSTTMSKQLSDIAQIDAWLRASATGNLTSDSRLVLPADIFLAFPTPGAGDGRQHILDAIERGAGAVLYDPTDFEWQSEWTVPHLAVPNLAWQAGTICSTYYCQPDSGMLTMAVTGTNGKTSTALWLGQAMARQHPAAVIGTLGVGLIRDKGDGGFQTTGFTTPDAVLLQRSLAYLRDDGAKSLAIEASSIGLAQGRLQGLRIEIAVFTNLTRDHLDFHGDMAEYEAAKARLFNWPGLRHAVINFDDAMGQRLVQSLANAQANAATNESTSAPTNVPTLTAYCIAEQPPVVPDGVQVLRASHVRTRGVGTEFHLDSPQGSVQIKTRMIGLFNVSNVLGVIGTLLAGGMDLAAVQKAVEALNPAPGRMQQVGGQDAPLVVVDYAHTPDALEKTLHALRPIASERGGQLCCVFGCGGDRDPGKRPEMGKIAELADSVMVTSDNPRSEEPQLIIDQILAGMSRTGAGKTVNSVLDRAAAIVQAVKQAQKQDVILIAGKGHEPYQEIKGKKLPFSDVEQAALALATRPTMKRGN